jgi:hypothetical protein
MQIRVLVVVLVLALITLVFLWSGLASESTRDLDAQSDDSDDSDISITTDPIEFEPAKNVALESSSDQIIKPVTIAEQARLQPWLEDVFLPNEKFAVRHNLVSIERETLVNAIYRSWNQRTSSNLDHDRNSPDLITLQLFPDAEYEVAINRVSQGRYGHLHANGVIVNTDPLNSAVDITISPDSTISISLVTPGAHFAVRPGQENPYHVVVQIDSASAIANLFVN